MSRILVLFGTVFKRHLLVANTSIACALDGLGDYLEQKLEGAEHIDKPRTARFASLGLVFGPWEHYWYHMLDKWYPGRATKTIVRKVLMDEFIMSPAEYAVFYVGLSVVEGDSFNDGVAELKTKFWPTYKAELIVWPIAQTINFYFLPPMFRMLFVNLVHLCWIMFLSYMKHS